MIRGIVRIQAELVAMNVRPVPENGYEYIGPSVDVSFAVGSLTTDADVIPCGSAV